MAVASQRRKAHSDPSFLSVHSSGEMKTATQNKHGKTDVTPLTALLPQKLKHETATVMYMVWFSSWLKPDGTFEAGPPVWSWDPLAGLVAGWPGSPATAAHCIGWLDMPADNNNNISNINSTGNNNHPCQLGWVHVEQV